MLDGKKDPVIGWLHRDSGMQAQYLHIKAGDRTITLTGGHLIELNGQFDYAHKVREGDNLSLQGQALRVHSIESEMRQGVYAPLTVSGEIDINGIRASCYTDTDSHSLA